MRCHGTVQHACNMIGSLLDNCVTWGRETEPGEWYRSRGQLVNLGHSGLVLEERLSLSAVAVRCFFFLGGDGDVCSLDNGLVLSVAIIIFL
jgi:hypothetical protein